MSFIAACAVRPRHSGASVLPRSKHRFAAPGRTPSVPSRLRKARPQSDLPDYGWVRFRKSDTAEPHAWQPQRVKVVQSSVGSVRGAVAVAEPQTLNVLTAATEAAPQMLRDMLHIRAAGPALAEDAVEPTPEITHRFIASAMSLGHSVRRRTGRSPKA